MGSVVGAITGSTGVGKKAKRGYEAAGDQAQYQPWNVSGSYYGDADFDYENNEASYNLSPELIKLRDLFMNKAQEGIGEGAFDNGSMFKQNGLDIFTEARDRDISKVGGDYYNDLQELMAPGRAKSEQRLANNLFASGRMGHGSAAYEGGGYLNPERMEYLTAMNREDNKLAVDSMGRARTERYEDMAKGLGYFGTGNDMRMDPYKDILGLFNMGAGIENQGMKPFEMGMGLGNNALQGNIAQAEMYGAGAGKQYDTGQANSGAFTDLVGAGAKAWMG